MANNTLNKDGTPRAKRRTFTPAERAMRALLAEQKEKRMIGKKAAKADDRSSGLLENVKVVQKYVREAKKLDTPEKVEATKAYYQSMIDNVDRKAELAREYLASNPDLSALDGLYLNIGNDIWDYVAEKMENPSDDEMAEICARHFTDEVVSALEAAGDPEQDPFAEMRRNQAESDEDEDEDDTLD